MEKTEFVGLIMKNVKPGMVFNNPGGGTSTIVDVSDERIVYKRGKSKLYLKMNDFFNVYNHFSGKRCYTSNIKDFNPQVFCSGGNGHGCHCTFIFMILSHMGFTQNGICGAGIAGDPFYADIL